MSNGKDISQDLRQSFVEIHTGGMSYRKIATQLCLPVTPIRIIIRKLKTLDITVTTLTVSTGRPCDINDHTARKLIRNGV